MVKAVVGVKEFYFDAAHYTPNTGSRCGNLHGHTYRLDIEVYGEINSLNGMVIDFTYLKKIVQEIIDQYDHKIIVPEKDLDKIVINGPFKKDIVVINYPFATTEYLALDIARKIYDRIKMPIKVKLYEGNRNYVIVEIKGE